MTSRRLRVAVAAPAAALVSAVVAAAEAEVVAERGRMVDALRLLGWHGCSSFTGDQTCRTPDSGRVRGSHYGYNAWCEACIALDALGLPTNARPAEDGTYPEPPDWANYQPTPDD